MLDTVFSSRRNAIYIAEIGLNHNGDMDTARRMISLAADSGADAVKFQAFVPELLNSVYTTDLIYKETENAPDLSQINFLKKFVFSRDQYRELKSEAEKRGIVFFSSVFDPPSLNMLEELGVAIYKLASSEITNHPLIEMIAETHKPLIISTGMTSEREIDMAVQLFSRKSRAELILMHCVSLYPLVPERANLKRIEKLHEIFKVDVGLSDHTSGIMAPILAAGYGARIYEKHFTVDKNFECPDKDVSITPDEFKNMIDLVENSILMIGDGEISFSDEEAHTARGARRSLFARRDITAGGIITEDDLIPLRPGTGIPVYEMKNIIGKTAKKGIKKDYLIRMEYF